MADCLYAADEVGGWLIAMTTSMLTNDRSSFQSNQGDTAMGDKGSKDKGKKEQQKKAQRTPKEKRKLKLEKKNRSE